MRNQINSTVALLMLLPLPVLCACGNDLTGIEEGTTRTYSGMEGGPALIVYPDLVYLVPGQSLQLGVRLEQRGPDLAPPDLEVVWSSSDPEVVWVSEDGEITALKEGEAWIYAEHSPWLGEAGVIVSTDLEFFGHFGG